MTPDTPHEPSETSVYLVLGLRSPARMAALGQLVRFALEDGPVTLALPWDDVAGTFQGWIPPKTAHGIEVTRWQLSPDHIAFESKPCWDVRSSACFIVSEGVEDPAHLLETFAMEVQRQGMTVHRVITWIDLGACAASKNVLLWYDACAHFSDCLILDNASSVETSWANSYIERFTARHYPCIMERMKKERIQQPMYVLDTQVRRISTLFDSNEPLDDYPGKSMDDLEDEEIFDPMNDPYFQRTVDGRRVKPIPDVKNEFGTTLPGNP